MALRPASSAWARRGASASTRSRQEAQTDHQKKLRMMAVIGRLTVDARNFPKEGECSCLAVEAFPRKLPPRTCSDLQGISLNVRALDEGGSTEGRVATRPGLSALPDRAEHLLRLFGRIAGGAMSYRRKARSGRRSCS